MGILSDRQIRERCEEMGMIRPFSPNQIREADGQRIISWGLSSYGYDIRCANKFKIFTNVNTTIVDPKNFDPQSFVEVEGDECIIPPNSFALAHTVEHFNIPRDLLVICLGKSTLARCFTGNTRVQLTNGEQPTFKELVERAAKGETFRGYSMDKYTNIVESTLTLPRLIGHEEIIAVHLSNGETVHCTPDHKFIDFGGKEVEAQCLTKKQWLMTTSDPVWVRKVERLDTTEDVYCLTVPNYGNFALATGVIVKNCGIIVNVTPLEPGWSGYLTLEFSNTTPLPAKIYANEGCAQLLFLKGDEVCEVAYNDRNGKYMNQAPEPVAART